MRLAGLVATVIASAMGYGDSAAPSPSDWLTAPAARDMAAAYPQGAQMLSTDGRAVIVCNVDQRGLLNTCSVVEESPKGFGFGQASLRLSRYFQMRLSSDAYRNSGGSVRIPIQFDTTSRTPLPAEPEASDQPAPETLALARQVLLAEGFEADLAGEFRAHFAQLTPQGGLDPEIARAAQQALQEVFEAQRATWLDEAVMAVARQSSGSALRGRYVMSGMTPPPPPPGAQRPGWDRVGYMRQIHHRRFCELRACGIDDAAIKRARRAQSPGLKAPAWAIQPTPIQLNAAHPSVARTLGVSGEALINCRAAEDGRLVDCRVGAESPEGLGFGLRALQLTPLYRLPASLADQGVPVDLAVKFELPKADIKRPALTQHEARALTFLKLAEPAITSSAGLVQLQEQIRADPFPTLDPLAIEAAVQALQDGLPEYAAVVQEDIAVLLARSMNDTQLRRLLAYAQSEPGRQAFADGPGIKAALDRARERRQLIIATSVRAKVCSAVSCEMRP